MHSIYDFNKLIEQLEELGISYQLGKIRKDALMVTIMIPGEYWEIEFNTYNDPSFCEIEIEKYRSDGVISGKEELDALIEEYKKDI